MSRIEYDVVLVGAGPANLTLAYRLVELADKPVRIAVLEKAKDIGGCLLSGAASNPRVIKKLFPDWDKPESGFPLEGICKKSYLSILGNKRWEDTPRFAMPPDFCKEGYAILSVSNVAAFMEKKIAEKADEKDGVVVDFYPGFPAQSILYDGDTVIGVTVDDTGDDENDNLYAKVTVFGDKGFVSRDLIEKFDLRKNAQAWAIGVKEVWETEKSYEGKIWHTAGYPLAPGHMGGGFIYGCKDNRLILGMVMALDFPDPNIRPPQVLQDLKKHPAVQEMLKGGKLEKYGAAVLPEGGYYSLPEKFSVSGAMMVGDALGVLDVKRFSGVDKAMESGYVAAEVIKEALAKNDTSEAALAPFQEKLMAGWVGKELKESRYFRHTFSEYPVILEEAFPALMKQIDAGKGVVGAAIAYGLPRPWSAINLALGAKSMLENPYNYGPVEYKEDRTYIDPGFVGERNPSEGYDDTTVFSTADIVFYAHTHYEEDNDHIKELSPGSCDSCIDKYDSAGRDTPCMGDCTAEVHQTLTIDGKRTHTMALENCVQCSTCEIVCPEENLRVTPALHGYGPNFSGM